MENIKVTLTNDDRFIGSLQYQNSSKELVQIDVCGSTTTKFQKIQTGEYILTKVKIVSYPDMIERYGRIFFFFKKIDVIGKDRILVLHGGNKNKAGKFVSTEGSLAIDDNELESLYHLLKPDNVLLTVSEESISFFNKLFIAKKVGKQDAIYNGRFDTDPLTLANFNRYLSYKRAKLRDNDDTLYFWAWLMDDKSQIDTGIFVSQNNEI